MLVLNVHTFIPSAKIDFATSIRSGHEPSSKHFYRQSLVVSSPIYSSLTRLRLMLTEAPGTMVNT
jgi:hypothetical protein